MKRKAKELTLAKRDMPKGGRTGFSGGFAGGFGSQDMRSGSSGVSSVSESLPMVPESSKAAGQPSVVRYVHTTYCFYILLSWFHTYYVLVPYILLLWFHTY